MEELTEYERKRQENIMRNAAKIAALGVQHVVQDLRSAKASRFGAKGYRQSAADKKISRDEPVVLRRSLRSRGLSPDNTFKLGVTSDDEPLSPSVKKGLNTRVVHAEQPCYKLHITDPGSDNQFLQGIVSLQDWVDERPLLDSLPPDTCSDFEGTKGALCDPTLLRLNRKDIARVVPERIFNVAFLDSKERVVISAGDKAGHLGLWDVDCDAEEGDGVHIYRPHTAPISGIACNSYDITKSYLGMG